MRARGPALLACMTAWLGATSARADVDAGVGAGGAEVGGLSDAAPLGGDAGAEVATPAAAASGAGTGADADAARGEVRWKRLRGEARERRVRTWYLAGAGLGLLATAGLFTYLSAGVNADIEAGFSSPYRYEDAERKGEWFNNLGWAFGVAGTLSLAAGAGMLLFDESPTRPRVLVAPAAASGGAGVLLRGTF